MGKLLVANNNVVGTGRSLVQVMKQLLEKTRFLKQFSFIKLTFFVFCCLQKKEKKYVSFASAQ